MRAHITLPNYTREQQQISIRITTLFFWNPEQKKGDDDIEDKTMLIITTWEYFHGNV